VASRPFAAITGIAGLLLLPAVLIRVATSTYITGRAVLAVDWIWPVVLIIVAIQAAYAVSGRLVNFAWGVPILAYDVLLAITGLIRFGVAHGSGLAGGLVGILFAQTSTLGVFTSSVAATTPFFFLVPMVSPAFPALRRSTAVFRAFVAAVAVFWLVFTATIGSSAAFRAHRALAESATVRIRERPLGDFRVGLKLFPDIAAVPTGAAIRNDLALADSLGVRAVTIVFAPDAAKLAIDSVGNILDRLEDSITVIVAIGYKGKLLPELGHVPLDEPARLRTIDYAVRRLHPDILLPAEDPTGVGARIVGRLPIESWERYVTAAARTVKAADPKVRVGLSISRFGTADSALYAWAARGGSPVDVVGFSLFPDRLGLGDLVGTFEPAADRWMKTTPPVKEHWVFATGAYPLNSGEATQERVIWQAISWASDHPAIKGIVIYEASDYAQARGLRAPNGRLRRAASAVLRAVRGLRESIAG
jgi:hypothetical protein